MKLTPETLQMDCLKWKSGTAHCMGCLKRAERNEGSVWSSRDFEPGRVQCNCSLQVMSCNSKVSLLRKMSLFERVAWHFLLVLLSYAGISFGIL